MNLTGRVIVHINSDKADINQSNATMQSDSSLVSVSKQEKEILLAAYHAFNTRNIEAALNTMTPDVDWPNGMEGGYVKGYDQVQAYWRRQWTLINPTVDPIAFSKEETGRIVVEVHQVVKDLTGKVIMDVMLQHVYHLVNNLIQHMEIRQQ